MSYRLRLPPALLDLTFARASARLEGPVLHPIRLGRLGYGFVRRSRHAYALAEPSTIQQFPDVGVVDHSLYAVRQKREVKVTRTPHTPNARTAVVEEYIRSLKETIQSETSSDDDAFTEAELASVYENLLAFPEPTAHQNDTKEAPKIEDSEVMLGLARRLSEHSKTFLALYQAASQVQEDAVPRFDLVLTRENLPSHHAFIDSLHEVVRVHRMFAAAGSDESVQNLQERTSGLPIDIEWAALVRTCVKRSDGQAAEIVLNLMKDSGLAIPESSQSEILALYASKGDYRNADRFVHKFLDASPTKRQCDLHIKAHVVSTEAHVFPTTALSLLHQYETSTPALLPPQKTYTRLISNLLSVHKSTAEAQAWDLFAHMRYVAHPTPDAHLYTIMIRACANPTLSPQPERALDLFTEMTVDKGISPTEATYTAAILACARSGRKMYVNEAFRLAKEMLDGHRDAHGRSAFHPSPQLFIALLEGAKRVGDLARARWLLAEMLRTRKAMEGEEEFKVGQRAMTHVFHAYAAYKPPFNRSATVIITQGKTNTADLSSNAQSSSASELSSDAKDDGSVGVPADLEAGPSFAHLPPQSREEVVREARLLFSRILEDTTVARNREAVGDDAPFKDVRLNPSLINAYLSVYYAHASLESAKGIYESVLTKAGVQRNARTYVDALERCAKARGTRAVALKWAGEIWPEWEAAEQKWRQGKEKVSDMGVDARLVERAHAAIIRLFSTNGQVRHALAHVKSFAANYPPAPITQINPKHPFRSTRTTLVGPRPLVRFTSVTEVPDDNVPPLLTFTELEILHHKLVAAGHKEGIAYVTWLCKAYEGALRKRRDATMKAEPEPSIGQIQHFDGQ